VTKRSDDYSGYQEHPRYGKGPRITGLNPSDTQFDEKVFLHWHSGVDARIPNTAVKANTDKQLPATIPVTHYFDAKRVCRKCGAYFIFFAEEQRYWYEELNFPLEADTVKCINCRKYEHKLGEARREYETLLTKQNRSNDETLRTVEFGVFLVEEGLFSHKVLSKLSGYLRALDAGAADRTNSLMQKISSLENRDS
jgi:hypothetical protein